MLLIPPLSTTDHSELYYELKMNGLKTELTHYQWGSDRDIHTSLYLGHKNHSLYLFFEVIEPDIVATHTEHFSNVYEDSCVEFFFREQGTMSYTNIEINPFGTALVGYGESRHTRSNVSLEYIHSLDIHTTYNKEMPYNGSWSLFYHIPMGTIDNKTIIWANAYKCGDLTPKAHYISLFHVDTVSPDFHQSSYFHPFKFST